MKYESKFGGVVVVLMLLFFSFLGTIVLLKSGYSLPEAFVRAVMGVVVIFAIPIIVSVRYLKRCIRSDILVTSLAALMSIASFIVLYHITSITGVIFPINSDKTLFDNLKFLLMGWGFVIFLKLVFKKS